MAKTDYEVGSAKLEDLWYWMEERHAIYERRQAGEPPYWTDDEILQEWKFTNVFRELDKGTIALRKMTPSEAPLDLIVFNTVWYRIFNRYEHATDIGWCETHDELCERMRKKRDSNALIFTSAHMTWAPPDICKVEAYLINTMLPVWRNRHQIVEESSTDLESAFEELCAWKFKGIGPFIAYEIVSDFRWTPLLQDAPDKLTWANIGPGCLRGLERLGLAPTMEILQDLLAKAPDLGRPLELREIEHSLCEFDKYQRVLTGAGRPRGRYQYGSE